MKTFILLLLAGILFTLTAQISQGQNTLTAENMALGGGGSSYLTGFEALFLNPANLYIREKNYKLQISLLKGGAYFDSALPVKGNNDRFSRFRSSLNPYDQPDPNRLISDLDRQRIVDRNFISERQQISVFQTKTDLYWFGLKWNRPERSYAVALRTRSSSLYEVGRGYFTDTPTGRNNRPEINRSFRHQFQTLHELSFGFAESFTFLNGQNPRLSQFIIGIAPKLVMGGSYLDSEYSNRYRFNPENALWQRNTSFSQLSSGTFTGTSTEPFTPSTGASLSDLFRPTALGAGLDIGITYLITFGSDLSLVRREDIPTEKSLRFSFSISDLGVLFHNDNPLQISSEETEEETDIPNQLTDSYFQGAPGEHLFFLDPFDDSPFNSVIRSNSQKFETLLPTTLNLGALFQINRMKLMGDISYSIAKTAFSPNLPVIYLGTELRPLPFLPIRAGTRYSPRLPGYYSFGGGIETTYFDITAAIQLRASSIGPTTEILGASMVGIKFYLQ